MAQNITLLGASYSAVPAVNLPKTGGGTAKFTDVTGTTAVAADVAQGKIFFDAQGNQQTGTGSGGGGGGKNAQIANGVGRVSTTTYTEVSGQTITVGKTGTYDVYWVGYRTSSSGVSGAQLYIDGSAYDLPIQSFDLTFTAFQHAHLTNVSLTKDQVIAVRARSRSNSYYMYVANLTIIEV